MTTEKPSYELAQVTCAKKYCNETFRVIISSTYTVIDREAVELKFNSSRHNELSRTNIFDDYLVIKCTCGHSQRVYLKLKDKKYNLLKKFEGVWHVKN